MKDYIISLTLVLLLALSVFALVSCQKNKRNENEESGAVEAPADHEHIYGEWVTTQYPSCRMAGLKERVCTVEGCGKKETEGLVALGHDLIHHTAQTVSCTDIGWDAYDTCSRCPYTTYQEKAALGHDLVHYDAQAVSCTDIGWNAYDACSRCDYTTYEEIAALGHEYVEHFCVRCLQVDPTYYTEGLKFASSGNNSYEVTGYNGSATEVRISAIYQDKAVTTISNDAFRDSAITSIIIPDSVTNISANTFNGCSLTSITVAENNSQYHSAGNCLIETASRCLIVGCSNSVIPADGSVTEIGSYAFDGRSGLTSIVIPGSVTYIGNNAFFGCSGLTSIVIPNSVKTIKGSAFMDCIGLTSISLPNSVTTIEGSTFSGCKNLTSISLPNSVKTIEFSAFHSCRNLTSIIIPESVTTIEKDAFSNCENLTSIIIPKSVTTIGKWAFLDCRNLTRVYYGGSASDWGEISIGIYNDELTAATIYYYSATQPVLEIDRWHYVNGAPTVWALYYTDGLEFNKHGDAYDVKEYEGTATEVIIPGWHQEKTVTAIEYRAFYGCKNLTSIVIPNSVKTIDVSAFLGCENLARVYYGGSASDWGEISIGDYNEKLTGATRYYYSETQPTSAGNWWHFVDNVPTAW